MTDKTLNMTLSNNFILNIPDLPIVSELAQDIIIPSIQLNTAEVYSQWSTYNEAGEKIEYSETDIGFQIDEKWDSYIEIYNWMSKMAGVGITHKHRHRKQIMGDMSVIVLNNQRNPVRVITFVDAWATTLGAVALDSAGNEELKGILTMQYHYLKFDSPDNNLTGIKTIPYKTDPD